MAADGNNDLLEHFWMTVLELSRFSGSSEVRDTDYGHGDDATGGSTAREELIRRVILNAAGDQIRSSKEVRGLTASD